MDLKENGSGVESDTKAGTDENFEPLLRVGDWDFIIARSDKEFNSFLSPLFYINFNWKFKMFAERFKITDTEKERFRIKREKKDVVR